MCQTIFGPHMYVTYACNTHMCIQNTPTRTYMQLGRILHPAEGTLQRSNHLLQAPSLQSWMQKAQNLWPDGTLLCSTLTKDPLAALLAK